MANKITGIDTRLFPKLNAKTTEEMLRAIKSGKTELREEFLLGNARLVLSAVQKFPHAREKADEMFQVGMLGLIKALDNFDVNLNVKFSTYAVPMIIGEIRRFLRESTALKVGRAIRDTAYKVMLARERLESETGKEISLTEIAKEIDVPYREVVSALDAIAEPVSIYEQAYNDGEEGTLIVDQIRDPEDRDYADRIALKQGVLNLPVREKEVILARYYMGKTQMEIAREFDMSQAQVSRLEKSAIEKLKTAL